MADVRKACYLAWAICVVILMLMPNTSTVKGKFPPSEEYFYFLTIAFNNQSIIKMLFGSALQNNGGSLEPFYSRVFDEISFRKLPP